MMTIFEILLVWRHLFFMNTSCLYFTRWFDHGGRNRDVISQARPVPALLCVVRASVGRRQRGHMF
jgi:hypothetical protein